MLKNRLFLRRNL